MTEIRPTGNRVAIRPDKPVTATESGILIPEAYQDTPPMSGIVVALGDGGSQPRTVRVRATAIKACIDIVREVDQTFRHPSATQMALDELGRFLQHEPPVEHVCDVGQRVIFPMEAGHEIVLNEDADGAVVIVAEDSILAVYDAEGVAA